MGHTVSQLRLDFHPDRHVDVSFDAPKLSSDGGLLLLRQADDALGLSEMLSECIMDDRDQRYVQHPVQEMLRQRLYQIACGYEDCNDADHLRHDPLFKLTCDRLPDDVDGLSSQPTLSRLENSISGGEIRSLTDALERSYVEHLPSDTTSIVLDLDSTDDETHGKQQLTFFHGYYDQYMYHPLLMFDGGSGELISLALRPGKCHSAKGSAIMLRRVIGRIRERFPTAHILVRGDSHFAMRWVLDPLDKLREHDSKLDYVIGLAKTSTLLKRLAKPLRQACEEYEKTGALAKVFAEFQYSPKTVPWTRERRAIGKAAYDARGANPRFIVTSLKGGTPEELYELYCQRGECENMIKAYKRALAGDRLSCSRFLANAFRLLLHAAAYRLMMQVRARVATVSPKLGRCQFDTLRLMLLKVAAMVSQSVRRVWVRLPAACPHARTYAAMARLSGRIALAHT